MASQAQPGGVGAEEEWIEVHVAREGRLRAEPLFTVPWSGRGIRPRGRWSGTSLRRTWIEACERVGVKVNLYAGTKHTFAMDAAASGVSERALQTFLGHADVRSTRRYARIGRQRASRRPAAASGRGRGAGRETVEETAAKAAG